MRTCAIKIYKVQPLIVELYQIIKIIGFVRVYKYQVFKIMVIVISFYNSYIYFPINHINSRG